MAGGRPASGPAAFDRQRWVAALAVVALLGSFGAVLGKRMEAGGGLVAQTGGGSGSGGGAGAAGGSGGSASGDSGSGSSGGSPSGGSG
ncbi:MAG TPA: hypothetical protein VFF24_13110, partial [Acidimicrobiia bacterium]|nr:hypothetical protein [Acidimicrobiia bacterium]